MPGPASGVGGRAAIEKGDRWSEGAAVQGVQGGASVVSSVTLKSDRSSQGPEKVASIRWLTREAPSLEVTFEKKGNQVNEVGGGISFEVQGPAFCILNAFV